MTWNLVIHSSGDRLDVGDPLNFATYRDLDVDADFLIRCTTEAVAEQGLVDIMEADLDSLVIPDCGRATVPTPPISAVLTTVVYLQYIGQEPKASNVVWTLQHYWTGESAEVLGLVGWQQAMTTLDAGAPGASEDLGNLHTWVAAVVESVNAFAF